MKTPKTPKPKSIILSVIATVLLLAICIIISLTQSQYGLFATSTNYNDRNASWATLLNNKFITVEDNILLKANGLNGELSIHKNIREIDMTTEQCDITRIKIPANVEYISGKSFNNLPNLRTIDVDEDNPYYTSVNGILYSKDMTAIIRYPQGQTGHFTLPSSITKIGDDAFNGCSGLKSIVLPDQTQIIGNFAFHGTPITRIDIPKSVTKIGLAPFAAADINIDLANKNYIVKENVVYTRDSSRVVTCSQRASGTIRILEEIQSVDPYAFYNCRNMDVIVISKSVVTINENAFLGCDGLQKVEYIGNTNNWDQIVIEDGNDIILNLYAQ